MTHYWVVGGEYADTTFERTAAGGPEERIGPFESYEAAKAVWQARAWATVDNARARYRIEEDGSDLLASSTLGDSVIQFIKLSKREYLNRLRRVFQNNSFVRVIFEEIEIVRHPKYPEVYGIQVKQRWNSSTYSDAGYLFVMIDFENPQQPLIHVRAWQPEKFADGSVIGLGDFDIIRGAKQ